MRLVVYSRLTPIQWLQLVTTVHRGTDRVKVNFYMFRHGFLPPASAEEKYVGIGKYNTTTQPMFDYLITDTYAASSTFEYKQRLLFQLKGGGGEGVHISRFSCQYSIITMSTSLKCMKHNPLAVYAGKYVQNVVLTFFTNFQYFAYLRKCHKNNKKKVTFRPCKFCEACGEKLHLRLIITFTG